MSSAREATAINLRTLPKVLLHEHLDGGLRPATLLDLLQSRGLPSPAADVASLEAWFAARAHAGSLTEYLRGFALTVEAMAQAQAMERVAHEAVLDAHDDGCVLAELRIAPILFEPFGVPADAAVEAIVAGLKRGTAETGLPTGLIVCAMRHQSDAEVMRSAEVAMRHHGRGVIAFDLAGPEAGHPATRHAAALRCVRDAGLPLTLHAGEADQALRVLEAARLGAARVGHGMRLADALSDSSQQPLLDEVRRCGVHLEVCPTSNVHTGAASSIALHPIVALWRAGLSLSYHTDNQLMSCVTMTQEAERLVAHTTLTARDLLRMARLAAEASFLGDAARAQALRRIERWGNEHDIAYDGLRQLT